MSYNKTVWHSRDIITAEKMQKIENQLETLSTGNNASFSPIVTNPQDGDTLMYNAAQQKWVNGAGGAGGVMIVHDVEGTLDKTWEEIRTGAETMIIFLTSMDQGSFTIDYLQAVGEEDGSYKVSFFNRVEALTYVSETEDGYPRL